MDLPAPASSLALLLLASELPLLVMKRAGPGAQTRKGLRAVGLLWVLFGSALALALRVARRSCLPLPLAPGTLAVLGASLLAGGMAIRWAAILTLGRFFTVDVAVHPGHRVIDRGPYRHVRHPSYSGLLLALLGVGLSLGDGAALLVLLGPCLAGLWWRISEEEKALRKALGEPYLRYCSRTKRLIPGVI